MSIENSCLPSSQPTFKNIVSVIVLSKNNAKTIGKTLNSILSAKFKNGYQLEVIVVDAKSQDGTEKILRTFKNKIKVIYDEGKGIGIARNIGVKYSKGDIICFVDGDCIVGDEHFIRIIETFKDPSIGIIDVRGDIYMEKMSKIQSLEFKIWKYGRAYSDKLIKDRTFAGGAFIAFRRKVFDDIGGFWEYPPYGGDDMDFSFRAKTKGYKITVIHCKNSVSIPRDNLKDLIKQQMGWGRGYIHLVTKYLHNNAFWESMKYNRYVYKIFKKNIWLYAIMRLILAPLGAIRLTLYTKEVELLPYWIIRRYAFLYGVLADMKKSLKKLDKNK
jgi:cellulose synthase/poly-beta-1,6-N-acetylglucosamine synthase-like glycosyltransferase